MITGNLQQDLQMMKMKMNPAFSIQRLKTVVLQSKSRVLYIVAQFESISYQKFVCDACANLLCLQNVHSQKFALRMRLLIWIL